MSGGNWAAGFLRSQLSDKDGYVSNTRVLLCLIICHVLGWVSALIAMYGYTVYKSHTGVTMTDIVTFLGAATTFTIGLCGTLSGIKTLGDAANNRAPNASSQILPPDQPGGSNVSHN